MKSDFYITLHFGKKAHKNIYHLYYVIKTNTNFFPPKKNGSAINSRAPDIFFQNLWFLARLW